jgi:SsrA-binding protein
VAAGRERRDAAQPARRRDGRPERLLIASNRRARHDYEILDTLEAGIALVGPEVKSLRAGRANLQDAHATLRRGEIFLLNLHISPYAQAGRENPEPKRERKLLLHRREIARLGTRVAERGLTLVPLSLYFRDGHAKVELALVRGRRRHDKREAIRSREEAREVERVTKGRRRS